MTRVLAVAALFASGLLMAGAVASAGSVDTTTTETTTQSVSTTSTEHVTTTVQETTTAPATTVVTTATVAPPTTAPTTTAAESTSSGTPTWVWVLLGLLGAALIGLLIYVLTGRGTAAIPDNERRLRLQGAVDTWAAQGWALVSESADTAVLQRGNEGMTVTVDPTGHITTNAAPSQPPAQPPDRWPE
jgi:hypothetical protein